MWYKLNRETKNIKKKYEELMNEYIMTEDVYESGVLTKEFINVEDMWEMIGRLIAELENIKGGEE